MLLCVAIYININVSMCINIKEYVSALYKRCEENPSIFLLPEMKYFVLVRIRYFLGKYQVIKEKYPGAVSSQPTKKTSNGNAGKDGKKSGKGKGGKNMKK